jgi:hypothetical protein
VDFRSVLVGIAFKRCLWDPIFKNGFEIFDQFSLKKFFFKTWAGYQSFFKLLTGSQSDGSHKFENSRLNQGDSHKLGVSFS